MVNGWPWGCLLDARSAWGRRREPATASGKKNVEVALLEDDRGLSGSFHVIPVESKHIRGTDRERESPKQGEHASLTNTSRAACNYSPAAGTYRIFSIRRVDRKEWHVGLL